MNNHQLICRKCKVGHLHESTRTEEFYANGKRVPVELLEAKCDQCGATTTLGSQIAENSRRLAARKEQYEGHLLGEEYLSFRKRYGLTQQAAAKIFGKGKIAFSRYENEESFPDMSTRLLIEAAIERPDFLRTLAEKAGVVIPLWDERREDDQRIKVKPLLVNQVWMKSAVHRQSLRSETIHTGTGVSDDSNISVQWALPEKYSKVEAMNDPKTTAIAG